MTISNSRFNANQAGDGTGSQGSGGALYVPGGDTNIVRSTFTGNKSWDSSGGAIYCSIGEGAMALNVDRSTFINNQAPNGSGGAISNPQAATGTIKNSTFTGDTAGTFGGAIHDGSRLLAHINNTIVGNSAALGGGISNADTIANCIVAGNTATNNGANVDGVFTSNGNNLIGYTAGSQGWVASDLTGTAQNPFDPLLNPLGLYGGLTQTMSPQAGSPAIDAGNTAAAQNAGLIVDQRGFTRIVNNVVDIGAVEVQGNEAGMMDMRIQMSLNPSYYGDDVILTATLTAAYSSSGTPTGDVEFFDGTTSLGVGTLVSGVASISNSTLVAGGHTITAVYSGDSTFNSQSSDPSNLLVLHEAPVNTAPEEEETDADTAIVFSVANENAIQVEDADAGATEIQVTLTATGGVLTLSGVSGLTFDTGDGTDDESMTFTGTVEDINTALDGLTFTPTANFNGEASVQIITEDLVGGPGGELYDDDTVAVTINAVNDAPVNSVPGNQSTTKNVDLVFSAGHSNLITIGDVDAGLEIIQVTLTVTHGTLTLSGTTGLDFSFDDEFGESAGEGADETFRGTIEDILDAMAGMYFRPTTDYVGDAELTILTNDLGNTGSGGPLTDEDYVDITINNVGQGGDA